MQPDFPNLRHLRAFREVAHHRGISAAADAVFLSQPAITQAISKLEIRLGVILFQRLTDGMLLTEPGEMFLTRVERMLDELATGSAEALAQASRPAKGFERFDRLMTAAQLRALIALSEARNFSIAARNSGISQPSIHRAARDLERLAGFAMFRTAAHGIELTQSAEHLARRARLAAAELRQATYELAAWKGRDVTRITIGSMPLSRTRILPVAMNAILREKALIQLQTIEGPYTELLRGLRHGDSDFLIGALRDPAPADDVVQERLFDDTLAIVVRAGHPLADRPDVTLEDTLDYPWIAPPRNTPAGSYLSDVLRIPEREYTPVRVVTSSLIMVRGLLLEGDYVTIISGQQAQFELEQGAFVTLAVDLPGNTRPIGLTFREGWQPTETQARFLTFLREASPAHGYSQTE
ncbi:MAG: LysR family transcriptional regulator [Rhodobacteraceae bacterium]|nr:LysR family transcriptional regulator [Paracoccaceae bacterium]